MSNAFRSDPEDLATHVAGWLTLAAGGRMTRLPVWDDAASLLARLGTGPASEWLQEQGYRLPTKAEYDELHGVALDIAPYTMPTMGMLRDAGIPASNTAAVDAYRAANMQTRQWCQWHDEAVFERLSAAGWDGEPVANAGKHWAAEGLYGWWRKDGSVIQPPYKGHHPTYTDYASTFHAVCDCACHEDIVHRDIKPDNVPTPSDSGRATVRPLPSHLGESGAHVKAWQYQLNQDGAEPQLVVDGRHGPKTEAATQAWIAKGIENAATSEPPSSGPVFEFIEARHYTKEPRSLASILTIDLHSTENPIRKGVARNVARWFNGPSAPQASAHFLVDRDETIQGVRLDHAAWAAPGQNVTGVQVEMVGQAFKTDWLKWGPGDRDGRQVMERTAELVAWLCEHLEIPVRRVTPDGLRAGERGITTHAAVTEAFHKSSHLDPGGAGDKRWPWPEFLTAVRARS